jgi:hypothetical protein
MFRSARRADEREVTWLVHLKVPASTLIRKKLEAVIRATAAANPSEVDDDGSELEPLLSHYLPHNT